MFEPKSSAALKAGEISTTVGKRAKVDRRASRYLLTLEDTHTHNYIGGNHFATC